MKPIETRHAQRRSAGAGHPAETGHSEPNAASPEDHDAAGPPAGAASKRQKLRADAATPWGPAQASSRYAEGIVFHSTAGHGGFHLDPARNARVHPAYRNRDGWYEEDSEWAKVAVTFPEHFLEDEHDEADATLRHAMPDAYERVNGVVLQSGESRAKDARQFLIDHATDWIVTSAIISGQRPGFVECVAVRGGDRGCADARRFLVPAAEYQIGRFGFVIDEARHETYIGPSSFIGWNHQTTMA